MTNKWFLVWLVAAVILGALTGRAAMAHPHPEAVAHQERVCNLYEVFTGVLVEKYGEQLISAQKIGHGGRYEIWKSSKTGTWTLLEVLPDNIHACVVGDGRVDIYTPEELMERQAYTKREI